VGPGNVPATNAGAETVAGSGGGAVVAVAVTAETKTTSISVDGEVASRLFQRSAAPPPIGGSRQGGSCLL